METSSLKLDMIKFGTHISFEKLPKVANTCMNFGQATAHGLEYDLNYAMVYYTKCK